MVGCICQEQYHKTFEVCRQGLEVSNNRSSRIDQYQTDYQMEN